MNRKYLVSFTFVSLCLISGLLAEDLKKTSLAEGEKPASVKLEFSPKSNRNPFVSPAEVKAMDAERLRLKKLREQDARNKRRRTRPKKVITSFQKIKRAIYLQGIVNNQALANGEVISIGESIKGAKLVKVGSDYVIFKYGDKFFKKTLSGN